MRLSEKPEWAKDQIKNDVQIFLGWRERLKIMFGFSVHVDVLTKTMVGITIRGPLWWPRQNRGYDCIGVKEEAIADLDGVSDG